MNLTEPNAGSDAMAGEMTARLYDDKTHYILNGQKIYITNELASGEVMFSATGVTDGTLLKGVLINENIRYRNFMR